MTESSAPQICCSNLSAAHLKAGHVDQALQSAEKCIELKPDWEKGHMRRDLALKAKGTTKVVSADGTACLLVPIIVVPSNINKEISCLYVWCVYLLSRH